MFDVQQTDDDDSAFAKARIEKRSKTTKYVLRTYNLTAVRDKADQGVYKLLQHPYDEQPKFEK
ncbi:hypothetical protein [Nonlabens sp.]|uniref:hypothetical protein n=1 Tax=Nonlabens sp. TaxID=1888209 RepID=UPI001BCE7FC1|nr:hypothetical protein [Nonlabens sp.]